MTAVESLRAASESEDFHAVCEAIDRVVDALRKHELAEEQMIATSESLLGLAQHRKWEVRRAVAHALRYVRHGPVEAALRRLGEDDAARVQKAAEESLDRRAERVQLDLVPMLGDERLEKLFEEAGRHSPTGRRVALRAAVTYTQFMVRGVYHEVARAMTPVNASLMMLEHSLQGPEHAAALVRLRDFRGKLRQINSILDAARMFVMETPPEFEDAALRPLVDEVALYAQALEPARQQGLEVAVDVEAALRVELDRGLIGRALENIVKNAVEASPDARPIRLTIAAKRIKGLVELSVTDYGCGLSPDNLSQLFRPYRTLKKGGTGLGLPLTKKIVEVDHAGEVSVSSEVGKGTTVIVRLPVRQPRSR